jgi:hypothetical protein
VLAAVPKYVAAAVAPTLTPWAKRQKKVEMAVSFILQFYDHPLKKSRKSASFGVKSCERQLF